MIENSYAIYSQLQHIGHIAIHDDWSYWSAHGMAARQGKPFYIDRDDAETLTIFFDDNIIEDDQIKNIISPLDAHTGEVISIEDLVESGQAVRVDTLEAILNDDYYIDRVKEALIKHSSIDGIETSSFRVGRKCRFSF